METRTAAAKDGCDVTPHDFDTLDFDDDTLKGKINYQRVYHL